MSARRVTLPTDPDAFWEFFAWPSKEPGDSLPFELNCRAWLADMGLTLASVDVSASPNLTVGAPALSVSNTLVTVLISGGDADTIEEVAFTLHLSGGGQKIVLVALGIEDALPSNLVPATGGSTSSVTDDSGTMLADNFGAHLLVA